MRKLRLILLLAFTLACTQAAITPAADLDDGSNTIELLDAAPDSLEALPEAPDIDVDITDDTEAGLPAPGETAEAPEEIPDLSDGEAAEEAAPDETTVEETAAIPVGSSDLTSGDVLAGDPADIVREGEEKNYAAGEIIAQGTLESITWTVTCIDPDGIQRFFYDEHEGKEAAYFAPSALLTLTGTGPIPDFEVVEDKFGEEEEFGFLHTTAPWSNFYLGEVYITKIVIGEGITAIGIHDFTFTNYLTDVEIPDSVTSIGAFAFDGCFESRWDEKQQTEILLSSLKKVSLPAGITFIGECALNNMGFETIDFAGGSIYDLAGQITTGCKDEKYWDYFDKLHCLCPNDQSPWYASYCEPKEGAVAMSGTCGEDLTWTVTVIKPNVFEYYDENHDDSWDGHYTEYSAKLSISGTGPMTDYFYDFDKDYEDEIQRIAPWNRFGERITTIELSNGITHLGDFCFMWLGRLQELTIPSSVTTIGAKAVSGCSYWNGNEPVDGLKSVTLPASLTYIGQQAFDDNHLLETVNYPGTLKELNAVCHLCYDEYDNRKSLMENFMGSPWLTENADDIPLLPGEETTIFSEYSSWRRDAIYTFRLEDLNKNYTDGKYVITVKANGRVFSVIDEFQVTETGDWTNQKSLGDGWIDGEKDPLPTSFSYTVDLRKNYSYFLRIGCDDMEESESVNVSFDIAPEKISLADCTLELGYTKKTYTGKALKPSVTVKKGSEVVPADMYTVSYKNNKNAGTATVTVTAKEDGLYTGSAKTTFMIIRAKSLKLPYTSKTVNASSKTQSFYFKPTAKGKITYKSNNSSVTINSSGKITIKKNYIGAATITVNAAAVTNYKPESQKLTITVRPAAVNLSLVKSKGNQKILVKWTKNSMAHGYQVQYSTSKTFASGNQKKTIGGNANIAKTLSGLKANKTYYVRVRAYKKVGGKYYYSRWSSVKSVKVK